MEEIIAFSEYLKVLGYNLGELTFNEAVALHTEVKKDIERAYFKHNNNNK